MGTPDFNRYLQGEETDSSINKIAKQTLYSRITAQIAGKTVTQSRQPSSDARKLLRNCEVTIIARNSLVLSIDRLFAQQDRACITDITPNAWDHYGSSDATPTIHSHSHAPITKIAQINSI